MSFIPKPQFPNVPNLPGVPQLLRAAGAVGAVIGGPVLGTAAALGALWRSLFALPTWGVFKDSPKVETAPDGIETVTVVGELQPVVEADNILEFSYRNEVDIPDFPVQDGSYAAFNRVNLPYEASLRFSKGGSEADRARFLTQIQFLMDGQVDETTGNLQLYKIITPEKTYFNVSPMRTELIRRGAGGAYYLSEVDLYFREIRTVKAQYTNTSITTADARNPSAQSVDNRGTIAGEAVTTEPTITGVVNQ